MESCDELPFGECSTLYVETAFSYCQTVVVTNTAERSTIDVYTDLHFSGMVWSNDCFCDAEYFDLAIHVDTSKCAQGRGQGDDPRVC